MQYLVIRMSCNFFTNKRILIKYDISKLNHILLVFDI